MSDIPEWMLRHLQDARRLFGLGGEDWHFYTTLTDKPHGSAEFDGGCNPDPVYLQANIELSEKLEDNARGQEVIYHEVLHGALEEINMVAEKAIRCAPRAQRKLLRRFYKEAVERFVTRTTRSLCANLKRGEE